MILKEHPAKSDKELLELGLIRCYCPPVNEIHLASYILIQVDRVYEYTKELYQKAKITE